MFAPVAAIFIASLLGSLHCAGMCGAFVTIASGGSGSGARRQFHLQAAYHAGRLMTYLALGAAAGAVGRIVNLAGALAGIRTPAALFAGGVMVFFGVATLLRSSGMSLGRMPLPAGWLRLMQAGHRSAMQRSPMVRALLIGLLTTLLPCGWLYAFVATAAGAASPIQSAMLMAVFWAGTLPTLIAVGAGARTLLGPLGAKLPALTALLLVGVGLYTVAGRTRIDPLALARRAQSHAGQTALSAPAVSTGCCSTHDACH